MPFIKFLFIFIVRFFVYGTALMPFLYTTTLEVKLSKKLFFLGTTGISVPFLIVIITAILIRISPSVGFGVYPMFSKKFIYWFLRDTLADIILCSSFLNNLRNRIDFLRYIYFVIINFRPPKKMIFASDVIILDPNMFVYGNNLFFGYATMISGHFVKNGKLFLTQGRIGSNTSIGAKCNIANGVKIGDNVQIGFGVSIGVQCIIEDNVIIHDACVIDDYAYIGRNSIIGKKTLLGRKSKVGSNTYVGNYCKLGSYLQIADKSKIPELTTIKQ